MRGMFWKTFHFKLSLAIGILAGTFATLFEHFPAPLGTILWVAFIGIAITCGVGPDHKKIPNFISSAVAGIIWGLIYFRGLALVEKMGVNADLKMFLVITVLTVLVATFHLCVVDKTWLGLLPVVFASLACFFGVGGQNPISLGIAMTLGILLAHTFEPVAELFRKVSSAKVDA